jgi:signal transduction histidine kinase
LAGSAQVNDSAVHRPLDRVLALVSLLAAGSTARDGLAAALGRPDVTLAYWLPDDERWVDPGGRPVELDLSRPTVTVVSYRDQRVAALLLDPPLDHASELAGEMMGITGLALEKERLELALHARLDEQEALRRVATTVARQHAPEEVLTLVAGEVAHHLAGDAALTARFDAPGLATVLAEWSRPGVGHFPKGQQITIDGATALAKVQRTGVPARADGYEGVPGEYPAELRKLGFRAAVAAPIMVDGRLWGAVGAASVRGAFARGAEARLGAFAELVGQAIANVDARLKLDDSRARIVAAADEARRRIERDLHDGAQQRLVALALSLTLVAKRAEPATASAVQACAEELQAALAELRELARGIHPVVLTERGLTAALEALAGRATVPVVLTSDLDGRLAPGHEAALYFVASEALTNVAKYAHATEARITLRSRDGWAEIEIADDGVGGATDGAGSGLRGLADRIDALRGRITVESAPDEGTTVRAAVPSARA